MVSTHICVYTHTQNLSLSPFVFVKIYFNNSGYQTFAGCTRCMNDTIIQCLCTKGRQLGVPEVKVRTLSQN